MGGVDPVFGWVVRLGLVLLFGAAALHKLRDLRAFTASVRDYRILPGAAAPPVAWTLVAAEISLVAALLVPAADPGGPLLALALLSLYGAAIALNLARGRHIDCGCLGPAHRQPLTRWLLARNGLLALGPILLLLQDAPRPASWIDTLSVLGGVAMLALLWSAAHQLAAAQPALRAPGRS